MKCSNILAILSLASLVLSVAWASRFTKSKIDKVHSQVLSYVYKNMGELRMMRSYSANLGCYNTFIPLINSLAGKARDDSKVCVKNANDDKDQELSVLENHRAEIAAEVAKITKYLADCSESQGVDYFNCLSGNADYSIRTMETIKVQSRHVSSEYGAKVAEIDLNEETCLNDAVDKAKSETDKAFDDLKLCLKNGTNSQ